MRLVCISGAKGPRGLASKRGRSFLQGQHSDITLQWEDGIMYTLIVIIFVISNGAALPPSVQLIQFKDVEDCNAAAKTLTFGASHLASPPLDKNDNFTQIQSYCLKTGG